MGQATPYLVGGIAFSIGAYSGVLTVVNVPNKDSQKMDWFIYSRAHWNEVCSLDCLCGPHPQWSEGSSKGSKGGRGLVTGCDLATGLVWLFLGMSGLLIRFIPTY